MSGLEAAAAVAAIVGIVASPLFQSTFESLKNHLKRPSPPNEPSEPLEKLEEKLEDAMENILLLLELAKGIDIRSGGISENLNRLKKAAYAAEDLMDELQYEELQLKVMGKATAVQPLPGAGSNSSSQVGCFAKKKTFFTKCFGRCRSTAKASDPPPSHSKITDERIRSTVEELNRVASLLKDACSLVTASSHTSTSCGKQQGSTSAPPSSRVTTSTESNRVYGRDEKRDEIINMLETQQIHGNNTFIFIVGIFGVGGVGKTTLARQVFNNQKFPESSYSKVWNCVSNEYEKGRLIREMIIDTAFSSSSRDKTGIELQSITNMDTLERMLKDNLKNKQLLLVLDDVWSDQWTEILPVLHSSINLTTKIVVTTREEKNAKLSDKFAHYCKSHILELEGLDDAEYRRLFDEHAFGAQGPSSHQNGAMLQPIGWQIAKKLKGNPLAAETVGAVLMENKEVWYWTQILNSDLCSIEVKNRSGIMPVLLLSYLHLPTHLQRCFSYCAIFPKDHNFQKAYLVNMWIAQSYVSCSMENERLEEVGMKHFEDLVSRSFFSYNVKPFNSGYKMHDLLHDLAMFVSLKECCVYYSENWPRIPQTCHHLFIPDSSKLPGVLIGQLPESLKLQLEHVRTLVIDRFDNTTPEILKSLKRIRALKCITTRGPLNKVSISNIGHLIHLRYLDLSKVTIFNVPESICTLYHLQTLIFNRYFEIKFPEQMCNLVNLRHLIADGASISRIPFIGMLSKLQELKDFDCQYNNIRQLLEMNDLSGELRIVNINSVKKTDDAMNAILDKKRRLKSLKLEWGIEEYLSSTSTTELGNGEGSEHHDNVLECLRPHEQLEQLHIKGHPGYKPPSWIAQSALKYIQRISLLGCSHWQSPSSIAKMPHLTSLNIECMSLVIELDNEDVFPSLVELKLWRVSLSFKKSEEATTVHGKFFPLLQQMWLRHCQKLEGLIWPSSLKDLAIVNSNVELPAFLKGLSSLTTLSIDSQDRFTSFDGEGMDSLSSLQHLYIKNCRNFRSLPEGWFPGSLVWLEVTQCSEELHDKLEDPKSAEWFMVQCIPYSIHRAQGYRRL